MAKKTSRESERVINWIIFRQKALNLLVPVARLLRVALALTLIAGLLLLNKYIVSNSSINNNLILDYLEVLKWPLLLLVAYLLFRKQLPGIILRIRKISRDGIELSEQQVQQDIVSTGLSDEIRSASAESTIFDLSTPEGRNVVLQEYEAKWHLERIYRIIFGTQLEALIILANYQQGLRLDTLDFLYEKHKSSNPGTTYASLLDLLGFPRSRGLLELNPTNNILSITDTGHLFIDYLASEDILNSNLKAH